MGATLSTICCGDSLSVIGVDGAMVAVHPIGTPGLAQASTSGSDVWNENPKEPLLLWAAVSLIPTATLPENGTTKVVQFPTIAPWVVASEDLRRDQASRYVFAVRTLPSTKGVYVREVFEELFEKYGLPTAVLPDNGSPFACTRALAGLSSFSAWLTSLGIEVRLSRPGCPQDNGAHERMHVDLRFDVEDDPQSSLDAQQEACDVWRNEFNMERPHASLGNKTPKEVYKKSTRPFRKHLIVAPYSGDFRRVSSNYQMKWMGCDVHVGGAFRGYDVSVEEVEPETYRVSFHRLELGFFSLKDEKPRVAPRLPIENEEPEDEIPKDGNGGRSQDVILENY